MMWDGGYGMGAGGVLWIVVMVAVLVLIVVGVVFLVRGISGRRETGQAGPSTGSASSQGPSGALQVLEERYARGEIDRKEFLQRKQDLLGR